MISKIVPLYPSHVVRGDYNRTRKYDLCKMVLIGVPARVVPNISTRERVGSMGGMRSMDGWMDVCVYVCVGGCR